MEQCKRFAVLSIAVTITNTYIVSGRIGKLYMPVRLLLATLLLVGGPALLLALAFA